MRADPFRVFFVSSSWSSQISVLGWFHLGAQDRPWEPRRQSKLRQTGPKMEWHILHYNPQLFANWWNKCCCVYFEGRAGAGCRLSFLWQKRRDNNCVQDPSYRVWWQLQTTLFLIYNWWKATPEPLYTVQVGPNITTQSSPNYDFDSSFTSYVFEELCVHSNASIKVRDFD